MAPFTFYQIGVKHNCSKVLGTYDSNTSLKYLSLREWNKLCCKHEFVIEVFFVSIFDCNAYINIHIANYEFKLLALMRLKFIKNKLTIVHMVDP